MTAGRVGQPGHCGGPTLRTWAWAHAADLGAKQGVNTRGAAAWGVAARVTGGKYAGNAAMGNKNGYRSGRATPGARPAPALAESHPLRPWRQCACSLSKLAECR